MLFDIPYLADWHTIFLVYKLGGSIGLRRQKLTDYNTAGENARRADYDYVVGRQIMIRKDGILRKSEYHYDSPYTISTQAHGQYHQGSTRN